MDIKEQIRNKYYTPTESVNIVYDIFKNFFNEIRVDLQVNNKFKRYLDTVLENTNENGLNILSNYNLNNTLDIAKIINNYTLEPPFFIFVHFPDVTITNENNDSINIKDLYARIPIYWNGTLNYRFEMIVTTYTRTLFNAGYCHSHLHHLYGNKPVFDTPCLGTGPLVGTCNVLTSDFTEDNWRLFCVELSRYVTVESLLGTPYFRMTNISDKRSNKLINIHNVSNYIWDHKELLIETIHNLVSKKLLNFKYVNGEYNFANSEAELIRIISNEFIAIYNDKFNKNEVNETLLQLANRSFVIKVKYYNDNYYYTGRITNKIPSNAVLFTFKGKDIKTVITDDITDIKETFILNPDKISYIATKLLEFININYGKEQIN